MSYQNCNLLEGLRPNDLQHMVSDLIEIDTYRSKMGEDTDVCVVSFEVRDRSPAKDLMDFIEKGYHYVLDADVSSGESNAGDYYVFVEIPRTSKLIEHITDLLHGVTKLTGIEEFKFKFYNDHTVRVADSQELEVVPNSPAEYEAMQVNIRTEDVKRFFSKTLMDDFVLENDVISIIKPFGNVIKLQMVKEGTADTILEGFSDPVSMDTEAMSEVFWLTKVVGDYNINKLGENFIFSNDSNAMILRRL